MNITIQVDEISLATVVEGVYAVDEDGDRYLAGQNTVANLVADQITARLIRDDQYLRLRDEVLALRKEMIREALRPTIETAISTPIRKTNTYGEPTGQETTLREVIVDEARKYLGEPADSYNRQRGTVLQEHVRKEVKAAFAAEIATAVKEARETVSKEIGEQVGAQIAEAIRLSATTKR